jgi:hypothetical protein
MNRRAPDAVVDLMAAARAVGDDEIVGAGLARGKSESSPTLSSNPKRTKTLRRPAPGDLPSALIDDFVSTS